MAFFAVLTDAGFMPADTEGVIVLNTVIVMGNLAKAVEVRNLPSGVSIANFDVVVPQVDGTPDTVPVALFDPPDEALEWEAGRPLLVVGRVRRRFFRVGPSTQSRTEVVAEKAVPISRGEEARLALTSVAPAIEGALEELQPPGL
ncbi:MAG TPA: single-stranded DNA-binding protein [Acidimicrobiales bacterium]|nr:single-stranded DNA-binding protein [Acidimicrobiales bacterium]